jgi:hypothetical protein
MGCTVSSLLWAARPCSRPCIRRNFWQHFALPRSRQPHESRSCQTEFSATLCIPSFKERRMEFDWDSRVPNSTRCRTALTFMRCSLLERGRTTAVASTIAFSCSSACALMLSSKGIEIEFMVRAFRCDYILLSSNQQNFHLKCITLYVDPSASQ